MSLLARVHRDRRRVGPSSSSSTTAPASRRPTSAIRRETASPCWVSSSAFSSTSIHFGLPTSRASSSIASQMRMISECASSNASSIVSSGTWSAPASIIVSASRVPTTIRSSADSSICWYVGLTMSSPSIRPMRTAPTGPRNGSGEIASAAEAPLIARMSCGTTMSADSTVQITCTSFLKPFGQSGRIGRSIMRAVSVARSVARPSRLKKPPGIFPAAYIRSSTSTVSGKKSASARAPAARRPSRGSSCRPLRTTTAPSACLASLPVSNVDLRAHRRRTPWPVARC